MNEVEVSKAVIPHQRSVFDDLVEQTLNTVKSTSARVYQQTFGLWADYCSNHAVDTLDFRPVVVNHFLAQRPVTWETRKRQMSAIRKLAKMYWILTGIDDAQRIYMALKETTPTDENLVVSNRSRHALSPTEVYKVLDAWGTTTPLQRRNRALIAFMTMTGVRRDEVRKLRWSDIDFANRTALVLGKRDKPRDVTIFGQAAINALLQWRSDIPNYEYVFPVLTRSQEVSVDKPMDGQTVFRIIKNTEKRSGVKFSPHTLRRTLITEALSTGAPIADVKEQAGHESEAVTLRYARPVNAHERHERFKLRFGN